MLTIDLLPENARKARLSQVEQLHRAPLLWVIGGVMLALPMLLFIPLQVRRQQVQRLTAKIQELQPRAQEVDQLKRFLQELRAQETAFRGLGKERGFWSKRLNRLSDLTPDGVWFTELTLDETKGLVIQGAAISQTGDEMVSVGRLVTDLKASADFSSAIIKDVQIESIKRIQEKDIELVQFTLTCSLVSKPSS